MIKLLNYNFEKLSKICDSEDDGEFSKEVLKIFSSKDNALNWIAKLLNKALSSKGYTKVYYGNDNPNEVSIYFKAFKTYEALRSILTLVADGDKEQFDINARKLNLKSENGVIDKDSINNFYTGKIKEGTPYVRVSFMEGDWEVITGDIEDVIISETADYWNFPIGTVAEIFDDNKDIKPSDFQFQDCDNDMFYPELIKSEVLQDKLPYDFDQNAFASWNYARRLI